jgi:hypothetical protein
MPIIQEIEDDEDESLSSTAEAEKKYLVRAESRKPPQWN